MMEAAPPRHGKRQSAECRYASRASSCLALNGLSFLVLGTASDARRSATHQFVNWRQPRSILVASSLANAGYRRGAPTLEPDR
jgi:hypothetical protein